MIPKQFPDMKSIPQTGILNPTSLATNRQYMKTAYDREAVESQRSCLRLVCFVLSAICAFNTMFAAMMVCKNAQLIEENQLLMRTYEAVLYQGSKNTKVKDYELASEEPVLFESIKLANMVDIRPKYQYRAEQCPPCTTEKPTPVEPYRNPVSILNEETGGRAKYECLHSCINPPIHVAYVKINSSELAGKEWKGTGVNKQESKKHAAFLAIKEVYPHLVDYILEEHLPDLGYNPRCQKPTFELFAEQKKC